jgi:hypothetical protein
MASMTIPHERALTLLFAEIGEVVAREHEVLLGKALEHHLPDTATAAWEAL